MIEGAIVVWLALTAASLAFVVWDSIANGVTSWVQRAAWILVTAYAGPVGLFFYLLGCRRPFPGAHDAYTRAPWKQALNSEMHCVAGDATGIILAASFVPALHLANGWDITIEYVAGFVSGLLIFQALMMRAMYGGDYWLAVRKTFFAEAVSMNFVMLGMIPTMVVLAHAWPGSGEPASPAFWFRMSLATIAGGILAYPINHWLVAKRLKHGCMTLPGADGPAPHLGHRSPEKPAAAEAMPGMTMAMPGMKMDEAQGDPESGPEMAMGTIGTGRAAALIAASFVVLLAAVWLTSRFVPISFGIG